MGGSGRCCRSGGLNGVGAAVEADVVEVVMGIAVVPVVAAEVERTKAPTIGEKLQRKREQECQ